MKLVRYESGSKAKLSLARSSIKKGQERNVEVSIVGENEVVVGEYLKERVEMEYGVVCDSEECEM